MRVGDHAHRAAVHRPADVHDARRQHAEPAPGAPANLAGRLVAKLKEWTGQPWLVAAEGGVLEVEDNLGGGTVVTITVPYRSRNDEGVAA